MKVSVVILNWNGRDFLEKFLPAVVAHSEGCAEVVVADNASRDGSIEFLKDRYPQIRLIEHPENGGFSKGYNDALRQVDAEYYVLLNSDVEVTENWIVPIIEMMDADPSIAACQPKIRSFHERSKFEYAGAAGGFIDAYGYPFCRGRIFDVLEDDQGQYDDACEVFWATGACLFVRAEAYHALGGLDEDFFAHMEEIDFCWRLKNSGYKIMYCPDSTVFHVGGGSLPKESPRKTYLNFRNNLSLLVKNLPAKRLGWVLFVRYLLDMFAWLNFLVKGRRGDAAAVWSAYSHFLRSLPRNMRKRRALQQPDAEQVLWGSIVFEHFARGVMVFSELKKSKWH
ncbi:MAG: glycosyltransferase family 2 protein [Verrucomicrobia bacterium]|nr:glycosyltransferase family 2 protein [Verrucomicrobiota bacterium]